MASTRSTQGPGFGALEIARQERAERERKEQQQQANFDREMRLREQELQMKSQSMGDIIARLERVEQSLSRIESPLSSHETQYFYPFSLVIKDK